MGWTENICTSRRNITSGAISECNQLSHSICLRLTLCTEKISCFQEIKVTTIPKTNSSTNELTKYWHQTRAMPDCCTHTKKQAYISSHSYCDSVFQIIIQDKNSWVHRYKVRHELWTDTFINFSILSFSSKLLLIQWNY